MNRETARILIECTHTLATRLHSGIQRVVRNVLRHARGVQDELGVECVPVTFADGEFYAVRNDRQSALLGKFAGWLQNLDHAAAIRREDGSPGKRLRRFFHPKTQMQKLAGVARRLSNRRIHFTQRDVLLLLDASWQVPAWPAVRQAKQNGCHVGCVCYDLIPFQSPQFCVPELAKGFRDWFGHAVRHADFFIAISRHVRRELEATVRSSFPDIDMPASRFDSFPLGADFSRTLTGRVRREIRELLAAGRSAAPYLTVGTIAPHKNHRFLLDAFDLVWATCPQTRLLIVGKPGWMCDDVLRRITQHPAYGSTLQLLTDLSDAELRLCYQGCRALVAPSRNEGFGLPLVEALHCGLPVLAGDTPIHREVGGECCAYFDLADPAALATIVQNIEVDGRFPAVGRAGKVAVTTWQDSCRELLTKTLRMSQQLGASNPTATGPSPLQHRAA